VGVCIISRFEIFRVMTNLCMNRCHVRRLRRHAISSNNMADTRTSVAEAAVTPHTVQGLRNDLWE